MRENAPESRVVVDTCEILFGESQANKIVERQSQSGNSNNKSSRNKKQNLSVHKRVSLKLSDNNKKL